MIQDHLRRFPRFDHLSDAEIRTLERRMKPRRFTAGQVLVREGARAAGPGAEVFLILRGAVNVTKKPVAGGVPVAVTLGPGDLFGVVALARDVRRSASCTAATDGLLATLTRGALAELRSDDPALAARLQLLAARQLAADTRALRASLADAVRR